MASASSRMDAFAMIGPVFLPLAVGALGYAAYRIDWVDFLTGPGSVSRILLVLFAAFNWKNVPFAWTFRVFYSIMYHFWVRRSPYLGPEALFKPFITTTHTPILEIDYNLHKSNSTYFTDLDVSRSHLVSYLFRPSLARLTHNAQSRLVLDPKTGEPIKGPLGILLGAVQCSFRREVAPYQPYELWSRVLSWDRKWLYIITHFVPRGAARPTRWLDPAYGGVKTRGSEDGKPWEEKKLIATAISKYVFKVGRFTVNPALVLDDAEMLPERPGGWTSGDNQVGDESADVSDVDLELHDDVVWDWRRVEAQRRRGMEIASRFHSLEEAHSLFDAGDNGALIRAWPN
ncbi:Thioesterase superfamily member 6 [Geosmithia morbida]|uniref:Thioesterase superfamily member 6 n=1 Tax=Geosmithia morbida TaxID=1094350 RepID=A0A9P5D601_9HYPO|nr:Thioesterase superfamily member 6 [Geosmithia morbida]KAF4124295.1 Thioesterase superfamily member 6 [Geosmithia morbida]